MLTATDYTAFISRIPERAKEWSQALERIEHRGCCSSLPGANAYIVTVDSWDCESGPPAFLGRQVLVKCRITGELCPAGQLAGLVALYSLLNGRNR